MAIALARPLVSLVWSQSNETGRRVDQSESSHRWPGPVVVVLWSSILANSMYVCTLVGSWMIEVFCWIGVTMLAARKASFPPLPLVAWSTETETGLDWWFGDENGFPSRVKRWRVLEYHYVNIRPYINDWPLMAIKLRSRSKAVFHSR